MSFLKKPFRKIKDIGSNTPSNASSDTEGSKPEGVSVNTSVTSNSVRDGSANGSRTGFALNGNSTSKRQSAEIIAADRQRRSIDKARMKAENKKRQSMARIEDEKFLEEGPPDLTKLYRPYSMNMSKRWNKEHRVLFKEMDFQSKSSIRENWTVSNTL